MTELPDVQRFTSSTGVRIYRIPCEVFPGFIGYAYVLLEAGPPTLVDTGSGYGACNEQVMAGFQRVREMGESIVPADIRRILITHGHIDHFGGLANFLELTDAQVGIHGLDRWVLTAYEERVIVATRALSVYLHRAGVTGELHQKMLEMYGFSKKHVRSVPVDMILADGQELDGMRFVHTPGHCPGQVCILLGDILLSADHVLAQITPHQAPESITAWTGLGHYLESLEKIRKEPGFDLALGGHETPIHDVYKRIGEIQRSHENKLERVLQAIREADAPATVFDATGVMYPKVKGFNMLLAVEEVGAHVEYLYQHGMLRVANLDEVQTEDRPALRYRVA